LALPAAGRWVSAIAFNFAFWGYPTVVYDLNDQILEKSAQRVKKAFDIFVTEEIISRKRAEESFKRFTFTSDIASLANSDFITEAIVERLSEKQELFNEWGRWSLKIRMVSRTFIDATSRLQALRSA
jgi:3-hydroxyacyl-CoA dehydrogenase